MARSPDGYLWLSSIRGLIRFDGVRFTVIDSTIAPALRAGAGDRFFPMLVDRSGTMWASGPDGALFRYEDGRFTAVLPASGGPIGAAEDRLGRLWVVTDRLRLLVDGRLVPAPLPAGVPDTSLFGFERDVGNGLWLGTRRDGLWHIDGDRVEHYGRGQIRPLIQTSDGTLWAIGDGLGTGLWRLDAGRWSEVRHPIDGRKITARHAAEGPDGSVWFGTNTAGVLRLHHGELEGFSTANGLSGFSIRSMHLDVEGALWVVTEGGVDRLRPALFTMIDRRSGLPFDAGAQFTPDRADSFWSADLPGDSLYHVSRAERNRSGRVLAERRDLPPGGFHILGASRGGGLWIGPVSGGVRYHGDDTTRF
jgi:ligand-binding sensor domain-containing protein